MTKTQLWLIKSAVLLAIAGGIFAYGWTKGSANELDKIAEATAEKQAELFDLADAVRKQANALLDLQREKEELIYELETQALAAPGSDGPGVSTTGGLRRLEDRWGPSSGSSN